MGLREVHVAREDLQRPEAEEEDGEDGERDHAEDADAEREARRQPVGSLDAGVGRRNRDDGARGSP